MKIADLIKELEGASCFEAFRIENADSYFAAAFLILDLESKVNQIQLDYFLPKEKRIAAFAHPFEEVKIHDDVVSVRDGKTVPGEVSEMKQQAVEVEVDVCDLERVCGEILRENECGLKPTKIIAILKEGVWNLTLMDNALGIVRVKMDAGSGECLNFEKGSLMNFMGVRKK